MIPSVEIYFDSDTESDSDSRDIRLCRRNIRDAFNELDLPEER